MSNDDGPDGPPSPDRRRAIAYGALTALAGVVGVGAVLRALGGDGGGEDSTPAEGSPRTTSEPTPTESGPGLEALVRRFAPEVHFGARERWYPTDPTEYTHEVDGEQVVVGFDALASYTAGFRETGTPPAPTVFYHAAPVAGSVVALQYWMYSVFDQFAVNFHWHDWELLQVFVDVESGEPLLLSASAHSRACPNNEFRGPALGDGEGPVVLSEVGSHSSTTDANRNVPSFERTAAGGRDPDVSNGDVAAFAGMADQPFAYGLPRDEGVPVPYAMPELDGAPLDQHPRLRDDVGIGDFVDADVTVRSWGDLARPPTDLPTREPGLVFGPPGTGGRADVTYALEPIEPVSRTIDEFDGPQLSFEFSIPGFVEDQFSEHISTAGKPWDGRRFDEPATDVTDAAHRRLVTGEEPTGPAGRVIGVVSSLLARPDGEVEGAGSDDHGELDPFVSVSRFPLPTEVATLLRSDPVALPTSGGVFRFQGVEPGEHDLVVNGPGIAPYAERFVHDDGTSRPGVGGRVTLLAREDAATLRADRRGSGGIRRVRIVEDFAGPVFDARPIEADRFAIPVHREGRYTLEITDQDGVRGSTRIEPAGEGSVRVESIETGKAALARALAVHLDESSALSRELEGGEVVPEDFSTAAQDASSAANLAAEGDAAGANRALERVVDRLLVVRDRLSDSSRDGYGSAAAGVLDHRADEGIDRAETAFATPVVE